MRAFFEHWRLKVWRFYMAAKRRSKGETGRMDVSIAVRGYLANFAAPWTLRTVVRFECRKSCQSLKP